MSADQVSVRAEVDAALEDALDDGALTSSDRALMATARAVASAMDEALEAGTITTVSQLSSRMLYLLRELGLTPKARKPKPEAGPLEQFLARMQAESEAAESETA